MSKVKTERFGVALSKPLLAWVDDATEDGRFTRSDVLAEVCRAAREQSKVFGTALWKGTKDPAEDGERVKVMFSATPEDVKWLDALADGADMTRTEVISLLFVVVRRQTWLLNKLGLSAVRRRRLAEIFGVEQALPSARESAAETTRELEPRPERGR